MSRKSGSKQTTSSSNVKSLQAEVKSLKQQLAVAQMSKPAARPRKNPIKTLAISVLVLLSALSFNLSLGAIWLNRNVTNTDVWVDKTNQLIRQPEVRKTIAVSITESAFEQVNVKQYVEQTVPPQISILADPLTNTLKDFTTGKVDQALQSQVFLTYWENTNRSAHDGIIRSLENDGKAPADVKQQNITYIDDDSLILNYGVIFDNIKGTLEQQGLGFVSGLAGRLNGTITLTKIDNMQTVLTAYTMLTRLANWLPILAIGLAVGAVAWASKKRRTLLAVCVLTIILMVLNIQALFWARYPVVQNIVHSLTTANSAAAGGAYDILVADYIVLARTLLVGMSIVAVVAVLTGPARFAVWVRSYIGKLATYRHADAPIWQSVAKHAYEIVAGLGGLAVLLLLFPVGQGAGYAIALISLVSVLSLVVLAIRQTITSSRKN